MLKKKEVAREEQRKIFGVYRKQKNKVADISPGISVITLYVNRLSFIIKRQRLSAQVKQSKQTRSKCMLSTGHTLLIQRYKWVESKGKKIYHANSNHKKWSGYTVSNKIDF